MKCRMILRGSMMGALIGLAACSRNDPEPAMVSTIGLRGGVDKVDIISSAGVRNEPLQYEVGSDQYSHVNTVASRGLFQGANAALSFGEKSVAVPYVADCYMKLGDCRSVIDDGTGEKIPVRVGTGFSDGIWYQKIYASRKSLIFRRSSLISQSAFTVDGKGDVIDVNTEVLDKKKGVSRHWARRVN